MVHSVWQQTEMHDESVAKINKTIENTKDTLTKIVTQLSRKIMLIENPLMQLHFAFLFACPLVLSYQLPETTHTKYKLVPPLNYEKEFGKIA